MTDTYDPAKDSFESYNAAIAALRAKLLRERCPAAKRVEVIGGCELYLGDCMEVTPTLERVDAVVTDPPYGIERLSKPASRLMDKFGRGAVEWDKRPSKHVIDTILSIADAVIIWGGNYFELPPTRAPLVWDKNNAGRDFADVELAWTNLNMVARRFVFRPMNMDGGKQHPTQKPEQLMKWCLDFLPGNPTVLDPFMGSGTTGVACAKTGRRFVGIEREESYFDIACERIRKAYAQPDMFVSAPKREEPKQEALI